MAWFQTDEEEIQEKEKKLIKLATDRGDLRFVPRKEGIKLTETEISIGSFSLRHRTAEQETTWYAADRDGHVFGSVQEFLVVHDPEYARLVTKRELKLLKAGKE